MIKMNKQEVINMMYVVKQHIIDLDQEDERYINQENLDGIDRFIEETTNYLSNRYS